MADFYDISTWNEKPWYQTGGTRSKVIVENPLNNKEYYFKTSLKKQKIDYKYEFWSEIIASEIGSLLGFNTLKYDIAFKNGEIGCISESMVTEGKNKLTEGISYLTGYDTTYNPEDKDSKKLYTFHLIRDSLEYYSLGRFIDNIIQIVVFDSIIGNGDRHQENWGIITEYNEIIATIEEIARKEKKGFIAKQLFTLLAITSKSKREEVEEVVKSFSLLMPGTFAKIYDNGSCLGREIDDEKIKQMLSDIPMINGYIKRGVSEIHWKSEKLNHFNLIENISKEYPDIVKKTIKNVKENYMESGIRNIVENIDSKLPDNLASFKLPQDRKDFIIKLVTLRFEELIHLI